MPIYEYRCGKCGEEFEKLVMSGDEVKCPACKSIKVSRCLSAFSTGASNWGVTEGPSTPGGCAPNGGFS